VTSSDSEDSGLFEASVIVVPALTAPRPNRACWRRLMSGRALDEDANACSVPLARVRLRHHRARPGSPMDGSSSEHRTIKLPDGMDFLIWAREQWPAPRSTVHADLWSFRQGSSLVPRSVCGTFTVGVRESRALRTASRSFARTVRVCRPFVALWAVSAP
jgi:hypothetical protein